MQSFLFSNETTFSNYLVLPSHTVLIICCFLDNIYMLRGLFR